MTEPESEETDPPIVNPLKLERTGIPSTADWTRLRNRLNAAENHIIALEVIVMVGFLVSFAVWINT